MSSVARYNTRICTLLLLLFHAPVGCVLDVAPRASQSPEPQGMSAAALPPGSVAEPKDAGMPSAMVPAIETSPPQTFDAATPQLPPMAAAPNVDASAPLPNVRNPLPFPVTPAGAAPKPDASAAPLDVPSPIHRYDFAGTRRVARDVIGNAHADVLGSARLNGAGHVEFMQQPEDSVQLPDGILAGLNTFTLLAWLDVRSSDCWQRAFDFYYGGSTADSSGPLLPAQAFYLSPIGCPDGLPTAGYVSDLSRYHVLSDRAVRMSQPVQLGVAYDATTQQLKLIVDGVVEKRARVPLDLRVLASATTQLGHSYYPSDPTLDGSIDEFRVYAQSLDDEQLAEAFRRGPDQL